MNLRWLRGQSTENRARRRLEQAGLKTLARNYRCRLGEIDLIMKDGVIYKKVAGDTEWDAPENVELIRRLLASD